MPLGFAERITNAMQQFTNLIFRERIGAGVASANDSVYKSYIPNFLYKPPFGFPLSKDVPEIRRLAKTPYVEMIIGTVTSEIASLDWKITAKDGVSVPDSILNKTQDFFYNPNSNEEPLDFILRALVRDILEIDAGVINKVYNLKGEFVEMYARDSSTFTKNPTVYGILPKQGEGPAYYQYGWLTGARPTPFDRNEIVYMFLNSRTESIYGLSAVECLLDVLQLLTYGVDSNLEYFEDNNIPKGILKMVGANRDDVKAFGESWQQHLKKKDPSGKWRRYFHKMPVMNTDGEFIRVGFSNLELELIQQQEWFTKLVWATFKITPSELGFTDSSNRATEIIQSNVFKRKAIRPLVSMIEYHFTTELVNYLPWIKGTQYEGKVLFEFDKFDLQEELAKRQLFWGDVKQGLRTVNEVREELNLEPIEGGDELRGQSASPFGFQSTANVFEPNAENPAEGTQPPFKAFCFDSAEVKKKALNLGSPTALGEFEQLADPKFLSKKFKEILDTSRKAILSLLKREAGVDKLSKLKAVDNDFIKEISKLFTLQNGRELMLEAVRQSFFKAQEAIGRKIEMNFVPNQRAIQFLQDYSFDLVKDLEEETKSDLRAELQRGLLNREGVKDLAERVEKVFKKGEHRAKMIARTEVARAENLGELDAWRQSGKRALKEWVAVRDEKTCPICKALDGDLKHVDEKFEFKGESFDSGPVHPSCRCRLEFHSVED